LEHSRETIKRQKTKTKETMDPGSRAYREDVEVSHTGKEDDIKDFHSPPDESSGNSPLLEKMQIPRQIHSPPAISCLPFFKRI
jgi:hypothetical protein